MPVELIVATSARLTSLAHGHVVEPTPGGTTSTWPNFAPARPVIVMSLPITASGFVAARRMPGMKTALEVVAAGSGLASWIQRPASPG